MATWHTTGPPGGGDRPHRILVYTPGQRDSAVEYVKRTDMENAVAAARRGIVHCRPCPNNGVCAAGGCVYKQGGQDGD